MGYKTVVWASFLCWLFTACWNPNCKWNEEVIPVQVSTRVFQYYDKSVPISNSFFGLSFPTERVGYIVGDNGVIYKTIDSAYTFSPITSPITQNLFDVYFTDEQNGFIAGNNLSFFQTIDGGNNWNSVSVPITSGNFYKLVYRNSSLMFALGGDDNLNAVMLKSTDGGTTWNDIYWSGISSIYGMDFISDDTALVCGHYGQIFRTNNRGLSWSQMTVNTESNPNVPTFLMDIKMLNNKVGFVIGYSAGASDQFVLKTLDGGFNWNRIDLGIVGTFNIYNDLNIINANEIVVSGGSGSNQTGFIIRSKDGGVTWAYDTIPSISTIEKATVINQTEYFVGHTGTVLKRY